MSRDPERHAADPLASRGNSATVHCLPCCTGCGACVAACPQRALSLQSELAEGRGQKRVAVDAARCTACAQCLAACPRQALVLPTTPWTLP